MAFCFTPTRCRPSARLPIDVEECGIDMLSASAHKINGPKGAVVCISAAASRSAPLSTAEPRKESAGRERRMCRASWDLEKAAQRAAATMEERTAKERRMRDYMISRIREKVPYCRLNGHPTLRLPNNVNFSFQFIEGESLLIMLDMEGICASSGSACTSGSLDPSHVLLAIGLPHEIAHGSLRLTLNEEIMEQDVDFVVEKIAQIVEKLRNMSPLYEDFIKKQK
ncbi:MAG: aminotransferase class V-fold PLP-dependent enzyme [Lachnospiraceae bacterium]